MRKSTFKPFVLSLLSALIAVSPAYSQDSALGISQTGDGGLASYNIKLSNGKRSRAIKIADPSLILQTISVDPKTSTVVSIGSDSKGVVLSVVFREGNAKTYQIPSYYKSNGASKIDFRKAFVHPKSGEIFIIGRMVGNDGLVFYRVSLDDKKRKAILDPIDISPWDRPDSSAQISSDGVLYWPSTASVTSVSSLDTKARRQHQANIKYRMRAVSKFSNTTEQIIAIVPCHLTARSPVLMVTGAFDLDTGISTTKIYKVNDIEKDSDVIEDITLLSSSTDPKITALNGYNQPQMGTGNLSCAYGKLLIRTAESYEVKGNLYQMLLKSGEIKLIKELPVSDYPNYLSIVSNTK